MAFTILIGGGLLLPTAGLGQRDDPFADFKANLETTRCTVPRIGEFPPYGDTNVGPGGTARLQDDEPQQAYDCIREQLASSYARSDYSAAAEYIGWQRFAVRPYLSRAHTNRYVVNYANPVAAEHYARFEDIDTMPVGSILAKDSFAVTLRGRIVIGSLSIMEKMPPGFNPDYGDWRFSLVLPDGRLFGTTNGVDSGSVAFCQRCHRDAGPEQDYMYFLPRRFRVTER